MTDVKRTIREATASDLPELLRLEAECLPEEAWTLSMVAEELSRPGGIIRVAEGMNGGLIGFAIGFTVLGEVQIFQIATARAHRRHGIAGELLVSLLRADVHATVAFLEVRADNAGAIAFYESRGWGAIATRPRYYSDATDAIVYRLSLPYQPSAPNL